MERELFKCNNHSGMISFHNGSKHALIVSCTEMIISKSHVQDFYIEMLGVHFYFIFLESWKLFSVILANMVQPKYVIKLIIIIQSKIFLG